MIRIMVVDDDEASCGALSELLSEEGFDVSSFQGGEAAWAAILEGPIPDVVVADIRMPGLDGVGLLDRIKARFAAVPVVLISAFPDDALWQRSVNAGAVDIFPKPIRGAALVNTILAAVPGLLERGVGGNPKPDPR